MHHDAYADPFWTNLMRLNAQHRTKLTVGTLGFYENPLSRVVSSQHARGCAGIKEACQPDVKPSIQNGNPPIRIVYDANILALHLRHRLRSRQIRRGDKPTSSDTNSAIRSSLHPAAADPRAVL